MDPVHKNCERCGKPLVLKARRDVDRKRFCSRECLGLTTGEARGGWQKSSAPRNCLKCGKEFAPIFSRHLYCSKKCQQVIATMQYELRRDTLDGYLIRLASRCGRKMGGVAVRALWDAQEGRCALTGVPMTYAVRKGRVMTNASIDRIDSRLGYSPGNVQLVCFIANIMKQDLSVAEFIQWCRKVVEYAREEQGAI